ncbi:MAG: zinc metallopeptidase [Planctomycetota bacterium]
MPFYTLFDPKYWLLVGPTMALAAWASWRVKSTFNKYSNVGVRSGMTGAEAAAAVCRQGASPNVRIERIGGFLSDHYDPRAKTLRLSPEVFDGRSISAVAVAAHEAGHAIQDEQNYSMLTMRSKLVPVTKIGSNLWMWVFMAGMFLSMKPLVNVGILLFAAVVLFQLVTLPVEFDASNRAKAVLSQSGIVSSEDERDGVSKVLGAAALTYVAGALTAIAQLAYFIMLANRRDGER